MASLETVLLRMNQEMNTKYVTLKEKQITAIKASLTNDVLAVLPTGYGKTVIIQETITRLKNVDRSIRFILAHPEHILNSPNVKKILMTEEWSSRISHVVVDEAHLVLSWGKEEFRPAYMKVGLMKTFLKDIKVLALTATANTDAQKKITHSLQMIDPVIVTESPNRPNVFLDIRKRQSSTGGVNTAEDSIFSTVDPFIEQLKIEKSKYMKTIMYVPLKWCGILHHRAVEEEEMSQYVMQYHAPQSNEMKKIITERMHSSEDNLRIVFATEAYGIGIDVPDIQQIVHIGPPTTLETYVQEIGRCGRNGEQSTAILYYNNTDVAPNKEHLQNEMRDYVKNEDRCRREFLLKYFGFSVPENRDKHSCCDICKKLCQCNLCLSVSIFEETAIPKFSKKQVGIAKHMLLQYFKAENRVSSKHVFPHLTTGLSDSFATSLASKPMYKNVEKLSEDFPSLKHSYLCNIAKILSEVYAMNC